jgi:hypothetical protein
MNTTHNEAKAINSPMAQLAKAYKWIEECLRYETLNKTSVSVARLFQIGENAQLKDLQQTRSIIANLVKRGHVTQIGKGSSTTYQWNIESPPFIFQLRKARGSALKQPSKPEVVKMKLPPRTVPTKSHAEYLKEIEQVREAYRLEVLERARNSPRQLEVEYEGAIVTIGRDPITGRIRVHVEDVV